MSEQAKCATPTDRALLFAGYYRRVFPGFATFIKSKDGTLQEARDLFQEALVITYERMLRYDRDVEDGYLFGICRHLWYRQQRKYQMELGYTTSETKDHAASEYQEPATHKILDLIALAGARCLELLTSFYYHNRSMQEIARTFGFSGERSATVQKYKCLEKVRKNVHLKKMTYEDFMA